MTVFLLKKLKKEKEHEDVEEEVVEEVHMVMVAAMIRMRAMMIQSIWIQSSSLEKNQTATLNNVDGDVSIQQEGSRWSSISLNLLPVTRHKGPRGSGARSGREWTFRILRMNVFV